MSFGIGASDVIFTAQLCVNIFERCKNASRHFRDLRDDAKTVYAILKPIHQAKEDKLFTADELENLDVIILPLTDTLKQLHDRLQKYHSLGTGSPRLWDKIGWALNSGTDLRQRLDRQVTWLNAFNPTITIANLRRGPGWQAPSRLSAFPTSSTIEVQQIVHTRLDTTGSVPLLPLLQGSAEGRNHRFGWHSILDVAGVLIFAILTLLCFANILIIGGFFIVCLVLFPFWMILKGFKKIKGDFEDMTGFFSRLIKLFSKFAEGLWD